MKDVPKRLSLVHRDVGQNVPPGVSHLEHELFMRRALEEARKGQGLVSPNPAVGAILVSADKVVATGHHLGPGKPHAEVECLRETDPQTLKNATLYVTLEPCSTTGRTPPCVDAIVRAGIKRVVVGAVDVNPRHSGRGLRALAAAGAEVVDGILAEECARLNEAFNKWIATGEPFVIAKCAMSLDGHLTRPPNESRWLTSAAARTDAMQLRANVDAILIGGETLRQDNPRLTIRGAVRGRQPWRVVLTRSGRLPKKAHLFTDRHAARTMVYKNKSLGSVLRDLGRKQITSVLIEGGGDILGQAFDQRLVDKVQFYLAPFLTGGGVKAVAGRGVAATAEAAHIEEIEYAEVGSDILVTGYPKWRKEASE